MAEIHQYLNYFKKPTNPQVGYQRRFCKAFEKMDYKMAINKYHCRTDLSIKVRILNLKYQDNINHRYYKLIKLITDYFNCYGICYLSLDMASATPQKTIMIYGVGYDALMCQRILCCLINGYDLMRINHREKLTKNKFRNRQNGKKSITGSSPKKSSEYFYNSIEYTYEFIKNILEKKQIYKEDQDKKKVIEKRLKDRNILNYKYPNSHEPKIEHAFTKTKFVKNRIING